MLIGGLDESGRGSILGPLVIAGVSIHEEALEDLSELGVKDSKLLSPNRRSALYGEILRVSEYAVGLPIQPHEVDQFVKNRKKYLKLNYLEAIYMARAIDQLKAGRVFVDLPSSDPNRFSQQISEHASVKCEIIAEHHADRNYPIVSAASIVAKVERDRAVQRLREKYGDFGSGYPSDSRTTIFLREWVEKHRSMPDFSRKSWKTWRKIVQTKLSG